MTDPIRAALERLLLRLDETTDPSGPVPAWSDSFYAACAALSADGPAVPEGREPAAVAGEPSDAELLGLDQLAAAWNAQADAANGWDELGLDEIIVWAQRQALARWGRQPTPPAEGEVGELVAALRADAECAEVEHYDLCNMTADQMRRAAELLQHLQPAQPVAVGERLPDVVEQALIKAECALADIAEGEAEECGGDSDDLLTWAEKRAAESLARIRPVMRQHGIHTSEWPPLTTPTTPPEAQP